MPRPSSPSRLFWREVFYLCLVVAVGVGNPGVGNAVDGVTNIGGEKGSAYFIGVLRDLKAGHELRGLHPNKDGGSTGGSERERGVVAVTLHASVSWRSSLSLGHRVPPQNSMPSGLVGLGIGEACIGRRPG